MADVAPSRSAILELRDERQAMVEGHAFLDEKCLAIAAEIVKELARYLALEAELLRASREAARAPAGGHRPARPRGAEPAPGPLAAGAGARDATRGR